MTPPADIINGSSVTLSCRGDANPPVPPSGYSLYKGKQLISSGPSHTISLLQPSHSGLYNCQASNNISVRGITFVKSTELNLDVQCMYIQPFMSCTVILRLPVPYTHVFWFFFVLVIHMLPQIEGTPAWKFKNYTQSNLIDCDFMHFDTYFVMYSEVLFPC